MGTLIFKEKRFCELMIGDYFKHSDSCSAGSRYYKKANERFAIRSTDLASMYFHRDVVVFVFGSEEENVKFEDLEDDIKMVKFSEIHIYSNFKFGGLYFKRTDEYQAVCINNKYITLLGIGVATILVQPLEDEAMYIELIGRYVRFEDSDQIFMWSQETGEMNSERFIPMVPVEVSFEEAANYFYQKLKQS